MGIFNNNKENGGFMDEIRCDEPSYLIWKWHPAGLQSGEGNRENAIRWGSSLRVKDGEVAVFVYNQKNGIMQDFIVGPFDQIIETKNFPVLASIVGLAYDGGTPFQAEVYFINLANIIQVKFGIPFFDVYDPRFLDFGVPVAVRGTISFKISDYREFIKLHRLNTFNLMDFQTQIRDTVTRYVKDAVANAPAANNMARNKNIRAQLYGQATISQDPVLARLVKEPVAATKFAGALEDVTRFLSLYPNEVPEAYSLRGKVKMHLNDLPGALEDFQKALELDPNNEDARRAVNDLQGRG